MKCPNCGNELKQGAKFCPSCGKAVVAPTPAAPVNPASTKPTPVKPTATPTSPVETKPIPKPNASTTVSIDTEDLKNHAKNFWGYFVEGLKEPSKAITQENNWFGYVQFVILNVLVAYIPTRLFAIAIERMKMVGSELSQYYGGDQLTTAVRQFAEGIGISTSVPQFFFRIFIYSLIFSAVYVLVGFLVVRGIMKNKVSFGQFVSRFGGFLSLEIALLLLADILLQFSSNGSSIFVMILILAASIIFSAAFNAVILLHENHASINKFYLLLIAMVLALILIYIVIIIAGISMVSSIIGR